MKKKGTTMFEIAKCESYEQGQVDKVVGELADFSQYIKRGDKVLIKANLLGAFDPSFSATAHPTVVEAVVKKVLEQGGIPVIGDSPAGLFNKNAMKNVYEKTGMLGVSRRTGCQLNEDFSSSKIDAGEGPFNRLTVINAVDKADKVINVCKVKCHKMAKMTCAVKNLYGYVPGLTKGLYHMRTMDMNNFADIIIRLNEWKTPVLTIVDGIVGMEGQGPDQGTSKQLGILAAGTNTYEIDYNIANVIGIEPMEILYLKKAKEQNLFTVKEIDLSSFKVDFKKAEILAPFINRTPEYRVAQN